MITRDMKTYSYSTIGGLDPYGQPTETVTGSIKININILSQTTLENPMYKDATYIGLTNEDINDTYIINYGEEKLKVLFVNPKGRFKQAFLKRYE